MRVITSHKTVSNWTLLLTTYFVISFVRLVELLAKLKIDFETTKTTSKHHSKHYCQQ